MFSNLSIHFESFLRSIKGDLYPQSPLTLFSYSYCFIPCILPIMRKPSISPR